MPIPIANPKAQYLSLKSEILEAVQEVFDSCQFILGDNIKKIEKDIPQLCDAEYGVAVNSGTDALVIALAACGVGPGDEVITTPYTFVATTESIMILGAKPVYVDIDPDTFNLNPVLIEEKITDKTKAILPVHLYGQCADIEAIENIAKKHGLKLVSDGAQAIGSKHKDKGIGAYGDASTLSFFPTKNLGACGDGGMVLTNDKSIDDKCRSLRFHGMNGNYEYDMVGFCSRMDEIQGAVLRVKMQKILEWNEARRSNAHYYLDRFKDLPMKLPLAKPENYHIYHQFTIQYDKRDQLKDKLAEKGIGSAIYYPSPLHLQSAYQNLGYRQGDLPISEEICKKVLSLPVFPELPEEDRKTVADAVIESVKELS
ncbi:MAG: DegT/DnrJ/EryC1/StrS family aminotransferase [Armatimonadota bacterium]